MTTETFASSLRNKLGPLHTLIQIIEDVKPVTFNADQQKLFEKSVADAKESFERIEKTIELYEHPFQEGKMASDL